MPAKPDVEKVLSWQKNDVKPDVRQKKPFCKSLLVSSWRRNQS
jgi:hypothetical protein